MLPPPSSGSAVVSNALLASSLPVPPSSPPRLIVLFAAAFSFLLLLKPPISPPLPPPFLSCLRRCRRCLRTLTMQRTTTTTAAAAPVAPPLAFSSPETLAEWLDPRLPPGSLASWGAVPGTKTLHNLWFELAQGETSLLLQPPLRTVNVATVRIRNTRGALLVESHQILSDGSVRSRCRPLSEKMRPGESVEGAALRAIREELGEAAADAALILPGSCETRVEERASVSYPGLPACYVLHSINAQVEGLPEEGEFSTEEAGEGLESQDQKAVFVRQHFWKWVDDEASISNNLA